MPGTLGPGTLGALSLIERTVGSLCHALSNSIGRLEEAVSSRPASIADTIAILVSQLQLRQMAWGVADAPIPLHRVAALAQGLPEPVSVDFSGLQPVLEFSPAAGRIVLNILLLAADSLPHGGRVVLAGEADDLFVRIEGQAATWPTGMTLCLASEAEAESALTDGRNLQMALTALLAHAAGIRLSVLVSPASHTGPLILGPVILRLGG